MGIFQKSVINSHLANLDKEQVEKAFEKFNENYSPKKIAEIKNLKEEEYQDGFLREIFVEVFGYTLKPAENYNLAREFKNQTDGKKADGAILKDEKAIVVIELKSTKTKDLKSITEQAFNYKNNQPDCKYVITSNFQKLRFYIDYANEYEEFDLFNLQKEEFELLYLILHKDSIFADLPLKLKNETKFHEDNISDKLYKDYSNFKHKIYANLIKNNPQYDKLTLFKKSQKFLDRLLFVFFAEDTGLVPPNAISKIVEQWETLKELDEYKTLYSRFVKFFEHLDKGHKYKTYELPAYNGGLFAPDEILDNITIDDEILKDDALKLSAYDFNTDVDVNILGHIFEHSLGEIEEITAEIEGTATEKEKSRRKKDGVFYTPKYITQYIVENTIGKLCTEKREELNITEIEFDGTYKAKAGKLSAKGKKLFKTLEEYKNWLLTLKIIDPACGSGAFLNQALSFLIEEHKHIDDILAELTGEALRLFDTDKAILENNLYGVDINDESVEIARLSLWLRTAQKGRKLSNLNQNIKCGNSLIDDIEIAGDKAFDWNKEFPNIMQNGGFDCVIGNPPYVISQSLSELETNYYYKNYNSALYQINLYLLFIEKGIQISKNDNYFSFIIPNTWLINQTLNKFRKYLLEKVNLFEIVDLTKTKVFGDAVVLPVIFIISNKTKTENIVIKEYLTNNFKTKNKIKIQEIIKQNYFINYQSNKIHLKIIEKIENKTIKINEIAKVSFGVKFYQKNKGKPKQTSEDVLNKPFTHYEKVNEKCKMVLEGKDIGKYSINWGGQWVEYGEWLAEPRSEDLFTGERILLRRIVDGKFTGTYINENYCNNSLLHTIKIIRNTFSSKYLLSIINSKLLAFYFIKKFARDENVFPEIRVSEIKLLPIKEIPQEAQQLFIEKADKMLELNKQLQEKKNKFLNRLSDNFEIEKPSKKIEAFYDYDFKTLVSELKKKKIKLSLIQQDEWEEYFNTYKTEINNLQSQISQTDKEIDQMVYKLYELTDEEIKIVEESV